MYTFTGVEGLSELFLTCCSLLSSIDAFMTFEPSVGGNLIPGDAHYDQRGPHVLKDECVVLPLSPPTSWCYCIKPSALSSPPPLSEWSLC